MNTSQLSQSQKLPDTCPGPPSQPSQSNTHATGPQPWGYLFPVNQNLKWLPLYENEYKIGRSPSCNLVLGEEIEAGLRSQMSKEHFRLRRAPITPNSDHYVVHLDDLSFNGTYVNEKKVRKGRTRVLRNNDRLALAQLSFEAYIFMENEPDLEVRHLPNEIHEKFAISRKLGSGAYGEVHLVFKKDTGQPFAMKIITKNKFVHPGKPALNHPARIEREVAILKRLRHPFVIKFHHAFDYPDVVYLVVELVRGGELFAKVTKCALREMEAKYVFYQLALAVRYLHLQGIIHRDVKLENILLTDDRSDTPMIKLADFGLSKFVDAESMLKTFCGTPMYIAPEVLISEGKNGTYSTQADVWSMGIVLYMCLSGMAPFSQGDKNNPLSKQIQKGRYSFPLKQWRTVSHNAKHLVTRMLRPDPKARITIDQIFEHPWLRDAAVKVKVQNLLRGENRQIFDYKENVAVPEIEEAEDNIKNESGISESGVGKRPLDVEAKRLRLENLDSNTRNENGIPEHSGVGKRPLDVEEHAAKRLRLENLDESDINCSDTFHSCLSVI